MCYKDSLKNWLIGFDGVGEHEEREREMIAELRNNFKFWTLGFLWKTAWKTNLELMS
jgi:hypothetical protein